MEFLFGKDKTKNLFKMKTFIVGSGAIGCELIKNLAMLGVGHKQNNSISITDPDLIEISNLSWQFLFKEKNVGQPKCLVAKKAVINFN